MTGGCDAGGRNEHRSIRDYQDNPRYAAAEARPGQDVLIRKVLEAGVCAPSGGNMQRWRFIVIRDPTIKQTVGAYYKRA